MCKQITSSNFDSIARPPDLTSRCVIIHVLLAGFCTQVRGLFHDPSIGSTVDFHVTNIVVANGTGRQPLKISGDSSSYTILEEFCKWQSRLSNNIRQHSDHTILLTG